MDNRNTLLIIVALLFVCSSNASAGKVSLETLLKTQLEGVDDTEVVVSKVRIPPNTTLPKHWHPGEEFVYILEGKVTLWQQNKENITGKSGEVVKVPLKQIHTGITGEEGVSLLVFRVHEQGQPERVMVK
ncbi:MAG: cupin domain-containing protein [Nitrosomonadaceae bacterium]